MKDHIHFRYGNGWLTAALVVFLLLCFMALLRGQEYPPPPPIFARETIQTQPEPDYMLKSPKGSGQMADCAMVTVFWNYDVDQLKPVLQSPKAFSMLDGVPMAIVEPPVAPLNILETCHFVCEYAGEWEGKHYFTFSLDWQGTLETSTDCVHWDVVQEQEPWLSHNIVGYFISELSENRYFRARPTNVQ